MPPMSGPVTANFSVPQQNVRHSAVNVVMAVQSEVPVSPPPLNTAMQQCCYCHGHI